MKAFRNIAATCALLLALIGFASLSASAQNLICDGSTASRLIDTYGVVTASGGTPVQNMPVRAYAYSTSLGLHIYTGYTDQFGTYDLKLFCGRPYYITVDTKHPNGNFGNTPDANPVNSAVEFNADSPPIYHAADFNLPYCTLPTNTIILGSTFERLENSSSLTQVYGVTVVALNPQDDSLQTYTVSAQPNPITDPNYEVTGLFPCSTYKVVAYFDPQRYQYAQPGEVLANTGMTADGTTGGVLINSYHSIFNWLIAVLR